VTVTFDVKAGAAPGAYELGLQATLRDENGKVIPANVKKGTFTVTGGGGGEVLGPILLDLDLTPGDQGVRSKGGVSSSQKIDIEVVAVEKASGAVGFSARIEYDSTAVSYVNGSFKAGTMFSGAFTPLVNAKPGFVEVGGATLGGGAVVRSGSSVAAARVAGIAGKALSKDRGLTPAKVRQVLRHAVDPIPLDGWYEVLEYGRIDATKALVRSSRSFQDVAVTRLTVSPARPMAGQANVARVRVATRGTIPSGPLALNVTWMGSQVGKPVGIGALDLGSAAELDVSLPAAAAPGAVEVIASVSPLPGETETANNRLTADVVYTDVPHHDVEVVVGELSAPLIEVGTMTIPVTVRNRGNQDEPAVGLEVFVEGSRIDSRTMAIDAGREASFAGAWTIGEDLSSRNRSLRVAASIPSADAEPTRNEWFLEFSVGHRDAPGRLQYADTHETTDIAMDAPWMTVRAHVPVLFFLPEFPRGDSRTVDRIAIGNYAPGRGDFASDLFIDNRLNLRDDQVENDFMVPGSTIIDPQGAARSLMARNEIFGSFWHYVVRLPVGSIGKEGSRGSPGEHFLETSLEWSYKWGW
jgi:hypothetical protein